MSIASSTPPTVSPRRRNAPLRLHARDVTNSLTVDTDEIPRGTSSSVVAMTLAAQMALPTNVAWSLRDDRTGSWLKDDEPLDEQVDNESEARVTLTPRAHLGGGSR